MKINYQTTTISKIISETPKVKTFILNTKIEALPGQYVMVWIPRFNEKPFGVVDDSPLTLSIARVGEFTEAIHKLQAGDKISFKGPFGNGFTNKSRKNLLVAGGYGFVPLYFLAKRLSMDKNNRTVVVIGARTKTDLPFVENFQKLGCQVNKCTDDGTEGLQGFTTDLVSDLLKSEKIDSVYTCGPEIMMRKVSQICQDHHISCQVSMERIFKCGGMGLCGECSINGILVCKDGPVFDSKMIF
jgi:dihydroorotate dehydrogenase electron transfer subunit